jgi:SAM-dependent methyltransferase
VYEKSARIYDLLYSGTGIKDFPAESEQLRALITETSPAARTLLDVACGTGAHLAELRQWFEVEGVDISPAMLEVARKRLPGVRLHLGDMRTLDLGRQFDAVICLFSSIGYVLEPAELGPTIQRLAAHVGRGGVLIVDGWIRPGDWNDGHRAAPEIVSDDETTVVRLAVGRREERITDLEMHHLVRTASGVEYFVERHRLAMTPTEDYVGAFEGAGLKTHVVTDYMPGRDRVVGVRPPGQDAGQKIETEASG